VTRYALIGSLLLTLALGGVAWFQSSRVAALESDLKDAEATIQTQATALEQRRSADAIYKARIEELERESAALTAELESLNTMEGRNAPLSDLLRATGAAADRLR